MFNQESEWEICPGNRDERSRLCSAFEKGRRKSNSPRDALSSIAKHLLSRPKCLKRRENSVSGWSVYSASKSISPH